MLKYLITILILLTLAIPHCYAITPSNVSKSYRKINMNEKRLLEPIITGILPNPKGLDTGETLIEIYNPNNYQIDLRSWQIATRNSTYTFGRKIIKNKSHAKIYKINSIPIFLANHIDEISLISPKGIKVQTLQYENSIEDKWIIPNFSVGISKKVTPRDSSVIYNKENIAPKESEQKITTHSERKYISKLKIGALNINTKPYNLDTNKKLISYLIATILILALLVGIWKRKLILDGVKSNEYK